MATIVVRVGPDPKHCHTKALITFDGGMPEDPMSHVARSFAKALKPGDTLWWHPQGRGQEFIEYPVPEAAA